MFNKKVTTGSRTGGQWKVLLLLLVVIPFGIALVEPTWGLTAHGPVDVSADQPQKSKHVRLKAVVDASVQQQFQSGQSITIRVPAEGAQAVRSIVIRKSVCFKPETLPVKTKSRIAGDAVIIELPDALFDRLDYQPIEVRVYQSNIQRVVLMPKHNPVRTDAPAADRLSDITDFHLRLKPDNGVAINFRLGDSFGLSNDVLETDLPFENIESITFSPDDESRVSVILINGDSLSGEHHWPPGVEFETSWGPEKIDLNRIVSISRQHSANKNSKDKIQ